MAAVLAAGDEIRLLFTGDILLARGVRARIERTGRSPFEPFTGLFRRAAFVAGNFEGVFGPSEECGAPVRMCFATPPAFARLLGLAGFRAVSLENNHSGDLGSTHWDNTRRILRAAGLIPLDFEGSPHFANLGEVTVSLIAFNRVPGRSRATVAVPSVELAQKLRLARRLSHLVVVFVHWGREYEPGPNSSQKQAASWMVRHGADVIIGHHPHVVQPPECLENRPVFYSLGNFVFDQRDPATKLGMIADLGIAQGRLRARALATRIPPGSPFPQPAGEHEQATAMLAGCTVELGSPMRAGDWELRAESRASGVLLQGRHASGEQWESPALPLAAIEAAPLAGPGTETLLLTLERRHSPLDGERGPRPYVYRITRRGLVPLWRGSGLAWPLADGALLDDGTLCALHRTDSFLAPDASAPAARVAAYRWNGFGFSQPGNPELEQNCRILFER
ncbi:MAG: CapA family protein [Bryobacteraceae bacterium]|nr:CapA family protein [Bryobacteraceae bacterium]